MAQRWAKVEARYPEALGKTCFNRAGPLGRDIQTSMRRLFDSRVKTIFTGRMRQAIQYNINPSRRGGVRFPLLSYGYFPHRVGGANTENANLRSLHKYYRHREFGWFQSIPPPVSRIRYWAKVIGADAKSRSRARHGKALRNTDVRDLAKSIANKKHTGLRVLSKYNRSGEHQKNLKKHTKGVAREAWRLATGRNPRKGQI